MCWDFVENALWIWMGGTSRVRCMGHWLIGLKVLSVWHWRSQLGDGLLRDCRAVKEVQ